MSEKPAFLPVIAFLKLIPVRPKRQNLQLPAKKAEN